MIASVVMVLGLGEKASATQSDVVLNLDGSLSCNAFTSQEITALRDRHLPAPGVEKVLTGPGGQKISYYIGQGSDRVTKWHIHSSENVEPVNFAMLRGKAGTRVFLFPNEGVTSDTDEQAGDACRGDVLLWSCRGAPAARPM